MSNVLEQAQWLRETVGVRALELGCLRVTGDDARSWLNGQITNDVGRSTAGDAVYALAVDLRGKILTDMFALDRGDDGFELLLPRERLQPMLEHFDGYIVMEDVELEAQERVVVTAQGPLASTLELGGFSCDRLGLGGVDVPDGDLETIVAKAKAVGGGLVGEAAWELARLRAARPDYGADFDQTTYPQEAGLKATAVSFSKGCYLGQEVVCMLENRGQVRRRLVQLRGESLPAPGSKLLFEGNAVGTVRSGVVDPADGSAILHAYVKRAGWQPGVALDSDEGFVTVRHVVGSDGSAPAL